jgi:hypothetical protein
MSRIISNSAFVRTASALGLALSLTAGSAWAGSADELVQQMEMTDGYRPAIDTQTPERSAIDTQAPEHLAIHTQTREAQGPQGSTGMADKTAAAQSANEQWLEKQLEIEGD